MVVSTYGHARRSDRGANGGSIEDTGVLCDDIFCGFDVSVCNIASPDKNLHAARNAFAV